MAEGRQNKQWIIAGSCMVVMLGGLYFISQLTQVEQPISSLASDPGVTSTMIAERTRGASPEMSWVTSGRESVEKLETSVAQLTSSLQILSENQSRDLASLTEGYDAQIIAQQAEINALKEALVAATPARNRDAAAAALNAVPGAGGEVFTPVSGAVALPGNGPLGTVPRGATGTPLVDQGNAVGGASPSSTSFSAPGVNQSGAFARGFTLTPAPVVPEGETAESKIRLLRTYLPAGSYAPAIVLSGVDASTGVTSQADPIPVLFRITGPAVTAGTRSTQGHRVDLTGCTVTGSARGDLSSERVYVRLLKLACIKPGQQVFETDVAGYMSGSGKTGSRGLVVSREGQLVSAAAISGALGGLASAVGSASGVATTAEQASLDQALQGAGVGSVTGGIQSAADRLSEYYIERAEQYQPVVSLYGGTPVEVVFLEGFSLE